MLLAIEIEPIHPDYKELAEALIRLFDAEHELREAKERVPSYTGQYSDEDFYANEQLEWNGAAVQLGKLLIGD